MHSSRSWHYAAQLLPFLLEVDPQLPKSSPHSTNCPHLLQLQKLKLSNLLLSPRRNRFSLPRNIKRAQEKKDELEIINALQQTLL